MRKHYPLFHRYDERRQTKYIWLAEHANPFDSATLRMTWWRHSFNNNSRDNSARTQDGVGSILTFPAFL